MFCCLTASFKVIDWEASGVPETDHPAGTPGSWSRSEAARTLGTVRAAMERRDADNMLTSIRQSRLDEETGNNWKGDRHVYTYLCPLTGSC